MRGIGGRGLRLGVRREMFGGYGYEFCFWHGMGMIWDGLLGLRLYR